MERQDLADWLVRHAGPSIKYRTLIDLQGEQDVGVVGRALNDMLSSSPVQDWLGRFHRRFDLNSIHSSRSDAFENIIGKCVLLGLRAGLQPFDSKTIPFRVWLSESSKDTHEIPHGEFLRTVVASLLAYAGYGATDPVRKQLTRRLESLHSFARRPNFDNIFVDRSEFKGIPKSAESHALVNPDLYPAQQFRLPWLHDIRGLANSLRFMNRTDQQKANRIIRMVLRPEYQNLPHSYGIAKYGTRYYVIGWAVHLPGYHARPEGRKFAELLLTLEFMAPFPSARESSWFKANLSYLEKFRTEQGTYLFPRGWLPEKPTGYWVGGLRMALGERKHSKAIECESTFWALRIKKLAELDHNRL